MSSLQQPTGADLTCKQQQLRLKIKGTMPAAPSAYLDTLADCLGNYLSNHNVGEEDPILLVDCLAQIDMVSVRAINCV